jgi:hypothetical protein
VILDLVDLAPAAHLLHLVLLEVAVMVALVVDLKGMDLQSEVEAAAAAVVLVKEMQEDLVEIQFPEI